MSTAPSRRVTPEEYLAFERRASEKHEYRDGEIVAMAGATRGHNLVGGNIYRAIGNRLEDRPCEVYANDMRVRTSWAGPYSYPDVVVIRGEPEFADTEFDTLLNPTVLIEVLSPSTEAYDRGDTQDRVSVERFALRPDGWLLTGTLRQAGDLLRLESIGVAILLSDIYSKVKFPEGTGDERPPP